MAAVPRSASKSRGPGGTGRVTTASAFPVSRPAGPHPLPPAGSWRRWSCRSASRTMTRRRTSGSPVPSGSPFSRSYPAFGPARPCSCSGPPRRRTAWGVQRAPAQWERLDGPSPWVLKHEGRCGSPRAVPTGLLGTAGERLCRMPRAVVRCLRAGSMDTRVVWPVTDSDLPSFLPQAEVDAAA